MKYIKLFEHAEPDIRVGDYVIIKRSVYTDSERYIIDFLKTHIAKVINIGMFSNGVEYIDAQFLSDKAKGKDISHMFNFSEIKFSAHTQ